MTEKEIQSLPESMRETARELLMNVDTNIELSSVILSAENKEKIQEFLKEVKYKDKLIKYGLKPMNRILMFGASGCGKTFLTKALANHLGYTMLYIDISQCIAQKNVAENLENIFNLANYIGRCIIFLDECDSIAWNRDTGNSDGGDLRRAVNSLFQQLDQMNTSNIFVSATNMLHRLDLAFERRFDMRMYFTRPDTSLKQCIYKFSNPMFKIEDNVNKNIEDIVEKKARQSPRLSYYGIQGVVEKAMKKAVLSDTDIIYTSNVYRDFQTMLNFKIKIDGEE